MKGRQEVEYLPRAWKVPIVKREYPNKGGVSRLRELYTPEFWTEGPPGKLNRESWVIEVNGLCANPKTFTWQELTVLPKSIADARVTSVTRFSVRGRWGGVKVADLFDEVQVDISTKYVRFWSYRIIYDTTISIEAALREKTLLAYEFDDEYLDEDYGGPVGGFCPYLRGYKSAKSIVNVELIDRYISGFWEQRGYPDNALTTAGKVRDMNQDGRLRSIPNGEVIRFLDEQIFLVSEALWLLGLTIELRFLPPCKDG